MSQTLFGRLHRHFGSGADVMSRREALKAALAASAGLIAAGVTPALGRQPAGPKVLVIGGGFAGLAAAYQLAGQRWDVQVIEARHRLGGRVLTLGGMGLSTQGDSGKLVVEAGGEFFGSNHPMWMAFLSRLGIERADVIEEDDLRFPVHIAGRMLDEAAAEKLYEEMDAALATMNADAANINADEPWTSPNAAELDRKTVEDWIRNLSASDLCKAALRTQLSVDNGVETVAQSYLGQLTMVKGGGLEKYWTDSELYKCLGGNMQFAGKIAQTLGRGRLTMGVRATRIEHSDTGVRVTCSDGEVRTADHAILALPPSLWPTIQFAPALPRDLAWQMGRNVKYLATVGSEFWVQGGFAPEALSDGPVSMTWRAGDGHIPKQPVPGQRHVLTAFSGAAAADQCRAVPADALDEFYKREIDKLLPGFAENFISGRFIDWPSDGNTAGSYSFPAPGQVMASAPTLRKGIGRLHFAGEHACPKFVGYMEGALTSGFDVARRLTGG